jgi:hypothetical protein
MRACRISIAFGLSVEQTDKTSSGMFQSPTAQCSPILTQHIIYPAIDSGQLMVDLGSLVAHPECGFVSTVL